MILAMLAEVLGEIYVLPKVREEKRKAILALKNQVMKPKVGAANPEVVSNRFFRLRIQPRLTKVALPKDSC